MRKGMYHGANHKGWFLDGHPRIVEHRRRSMKEHVWKSTDEHGGAWRSMDEYGRAWKSMEEHGGAWKSMEEHG